MSEVMRYAVIETALCIGGNILDGEVSMVRANDYDAAKEWSAEQYKQNEILRGLINDGLARETSLEMSNQELAHANAELIRKCNALDKSESALQERLELESAELAWSEHDSRRQAKELASLREELAQIKESTAYRGSLLGRTEQRLTAAEQRNAELEGILRDMQAIGLRTPESDAALKPTESGASEVEKEALRMENQRIQPARFKCLACGELHEGSGNLPCPKMSPMSGASE